MTEREHIGADGTTRQTHYGAWRQPWDYIVEWGIAPEFAAGNAFKYIRRDAAIKGVERGRDLKHARWYYARLVEMMRGAASLPSDPALRTAVQIRSVGVLKRLQALLTDEERDLLRSAS